MIIDLTGSDDDDNNNSSSSSSNNNIEIINIRDTYEPDLCEICYEPIDFGYHYTCCQHYCCIVCFRKMHLNMAHVGCPFDRKPLDFTMDIIQLTFVYSHDGLHEGSIFVVASLPMSEIGDKIAMSPSWQRNSDVGFLPISTLVHNGTVLSRLSTQPIYTLNIKPLDRIYILFDTTIMESFGIANKNTNKGITVVITRLG